MPLAWNFLHDYQKKRVLIFLDPEQDPLGAGYHILQSKIALGSGGFSGKGFLQGRSEEHTSELQSLMRISYAVFCLKKQKPAPSNNSICRAHLTNRITTAH